MLKVLLHFLIGFILGTGVTGIFYIKIYSVARNEDVYSNYDFKRMLSTRYAIRSLTNLLILYIVHTDVPMLAGVALGLTMAKNYILIKTLLGKGVK